MNTIVASEDTKPTMTHTNAMSHEISTVVDKMNARTVDSFKAAHAELERLQRLVFLSAERVKIVLESHVTVAQTAQDHAEKIISTMAQLREDHKALGE